MSEFTAWTCPECETRYKLPLGRTPPARCKTCEDRAELVSPRPNRPDLEVSTDPDLDLLKPYELILEPSESPTRPVMDAVNLPPRPKPLTRRARPVRRKPSAPADKTPSETPSPIHEWISSAGAWLKSVAGMLRKPPA